MIEVKSYKFRTKPPDLISKFKVIKEDWSDFVKYMSDLRNMCKYPLQMNDHCKDIHGEDHIITVNKKAIYENIHDVMKIKEWNNDIEFDDHPICRDSSSDSCSHSEESGSVCNFNKYKIIHNNIYSNNANLKRQKIRANYGSVCIPSEKREVKVEKKEYSHEICYKRKTRRKNILNSSCGNEKLNNGNNELGQNDAVAPNEQRDLYQKNIFGKSLRKLSKNNFHGKSKSSAYVSYPNEYDYTYGSKEYDISYDQNELNVESKDFLDNSESREYKSRKFAYKEKVKNGKRNTRRIGQYFYNNEFSRSNSLSNLSVQDNISVNDVSRENNILVKRNNKYEVYSNAIKNARKNNSHIDGSYAYNFAYMDKNDRSGDSTPVEGAHGTIMNLDEEIKNYKFRHLE
ncbi:conserved Plasmodium protein, unknown function [Plasmodium knowlesi strain H]|uniref:Uncharacterized protein n=3 Tax=Plasmodium knowlesi TaxID=5850 RepID=A0A5K1UR84_PLAKH|nr:conserved Plasmodium protein, unknown function [Plasmodium knowlesi strain H]OTN67093.1 Uncharacterized protein PKNOH_S07438900 [Plasmodium knowlesi]CAA9988522.1 conserved Plasmodium protein, unknown function [Plasmodium knowlesi strain H]SBO21292.1 conserved Plasmodium protein, unknown function [Plasmodium knowlesi strain H]SBO21746.1 conserved Plasmodium protein, unknown function [Plasmodium knowlesi strain H]VVS77996.1 conserved Plasmodium protein, unknown function [Plasmodium knowlesi s|eukprot:XP_002259497.1 hypothetical protein, conserved in Plasmodium species [Plasmodium knowlesi strain H]